MQMLLMGMGEGKLKEHELLRKVAHVILSVTGFLPFFKKKNSYKLKDFVSSTANSTVCKFRL